MGRTQMVSVDEIRAFQAEQKKFASTEIGGLFNRFKTALIRAWVSDTEDSFTDKNKASTKKYHEEANKLEYELRDKLIKLSAKN